MSLRITSAIVVGLVLVAGACGNGSDLRADAGADFSIGVGQSPTFDGCGSQGQIQNYKWAITDAPDFMTGDSAKVIREIESACSFTLVAAMDLQEVGTWTVELIVTDAASGTSSDTVSVEVTP